MTETQLMELLHHTISEDQIMRVIRCTFAVIAFVGTWMLQKYRWRDE